MIIIIFLYFQVWIRLLASTLRVMSPWAMATNICHFEASWTGRVAKKGWVNSKALVSMVLSAWIPPPDTIQGLFSDGHLYRQGSYQRHFKIFARIIQIRFLESRGTLVSSQPTFIGSPNLPLHFALILMKYHGGNGFVNPVGAPPALTHESISPKISAHYKITFRTIMNNTKQ